MIETEYIFIYGALRDVYKNMLSESIYCGRAYVYGELFMVNEFYPGIILNGKMKVFGEVYTITEDKLKQLDIFEGDEFRRTRVNVSNDLVCWIYEYIKDVSKFKSIKSGDWLLR